MRLRGFFFFLSLSLTHRHTHTHTDSHSVSVSLCLSLSLSLSLPFSVSLSVSLTLSFSHSYSLSVSLTLSFSLFRLFKIQKLSPYQGAQKQTQNIDNKDSMTAIIHAGADLLLRTAYAPDKFNHRVALIKYVLWEFYENQSISDIIQSRRGNKIIFVLYFFQIFIVFIPFSLYVLITSYFSIWNYSFIFIPWYFFCLTEVYHSFCYYFSICPFIFSFIH